MKKYTKTILAIVISVFLVVFGNMNDEVVIDTDNNVEIVYTFRSEEQYQAHFEKHAEEFGDITKDEYLIMANSLILDETGEVMTKLEKEDNDTVYYKVETNEFLILSTDGYIRTYFRPDDGIDYFNRQ
jgi:pyocin large subunit-like protein